MSDYVNMTCHQRYEKILCLGKDSERSESNQKVDYNRFFLISPNVNFPIRTALLKAMAVKIRTQRPLQQSTRQVQAFTLRGFGKWISMLSVTI